MIILLLSHEPYYYSDQNYLLSLLRLPKLLLFTITIQNYGGKNHLQLPKLFTVVEIIYGITMVKIIYGYYYRNYLRNYGF